jgi:hypothetical protein
MATHSQWEFELEQSISLHISTAPAVAPAIMERIALGYQSLATIFAVL